ncbi:hypothetical protein [Thermofilum pendens]|uniref:ABC-2 type transport system permease protein n=1 Tax=Thermofilum pendens (strain DSM 2475 / Hrk 5) TaxID=368408 RepID=A1RZA6_THEPD|nr:hypothetical protein [Thermofilum pendens]ABL78536.1 putative ABC-2 type transport system permease protein [Thermofilum pendens Hrk 5]
MGRRKAVLWLHLMRSKRYALSLVSGSLTDALWMIILLAGFILAGKAPEASSNYWGLVAWTILSNATWMIGGWVDYLVLLGLVEEHEVRGVSVFELVAGRAIPMLASSAISSLAAYAFLSLAGARVSVASIPVLASSLALLYAQSLCYGLLLASLSLRTGTPSYMLDILSLAFLGLAFSPTPASPSVALIPLLGPMLLAKLSSTGSVQPAAVAYGVPATLFLAVAALLACRSTEEHARRRGVRAVGLV